MRVNFDGSRRATNTCAAGWVAFGSQCPGASDSQWNVFAWQAFPVLTDSVVAAELEGATSAHHFLEGYCADLSQDQLSAHMERWIPYNYLERGEP